MEFKLEDLLINPKGEILRHPVFPKTVIIKQLRAS
jgi:hypothetical protein